MTTSPQFLESPETAKRQPDVFAAAPRFWQNALPKQQKNRIEITSNRRHAFEDALISDLAGNTVSLATA